MVCWFYKRIDNNRVIVYSLRDEAWENVHIVTKG